jgi:hypothetical protein
VAAVDEQLSGLDWATRADLLEAQRHHRDEAEARLTSFGRAAVAAAWLLPVVLAVPLAQALGEELLPGAAASLVVLVLLLVAGAGLLRHLAASRRLLAEARQWAEVDRDPRWRDLPVGEVPADLLTIHDARDDARLPDVAVRQRRRAQDRVFAPRMFGFGALAGLLTAVAVIPFAGFSAADGDPLLLAVTLLACTIAVAAVVVAWTQLFRVMHGRQRELNRATLEQRVYEARFRHLHGGQAPETAGQVPLAARVVAPLVLLLLLGGLVWRVSVASPVALLVALGLVAVVAVVLAVAVLRQRRPHVVPLLAAGPGLLQSPAKPVEATTDAGAVALRGAGDSFTVPAHEVLAVERVPLAFALAPPAVVVLTAGSPVVLAGRGVDTALLNGR